MKRREYLTAAARAASGTMLLGSTSIVLAQSRTEVFPGDRRVAVVDIHAHCQFLRGRWQR